MARATLIASITDAVSLRELNSQSYETVFVSATPILVGGEEVDILLNGVTATTIDGTVGKLSATVHQVELHGGVVYHVSKDLTTSATEVFYVTGRGLAQ